MERLTKKQENKYWLNCSYDEQDAIQQLGKLEDLQDELGIPLEVLFKGIDGIFYKVDDEIVEGRIDYFYKSVGGFWVVKCIPNAYIFGTLQHYQIRLHVKDYGKTWWLEEPKEGLENAKD